MAEMDAATRGTISKLVNKVADWQAARERIDNRISNAKKVLKVLAKEHRTIERHETQRAVLVVSWPVTRQGNNDDVMEAVCRLVDVEDFAAIYPRRFDSKAFGGVVEHHRYEHLESLVPTKKAKTPTVEVRQLEA